LTRFFDLVRRGVDASISNTLVITNKAKASVKDDIKFADVFLLMLMKKKIFRPVSATILIKRKINLATQHIETGIN
jgi:hypothetical protein